jgi:dTDP-4-dehydrorhamnose 3,5-epimerase
MSYKTFPIKDLVQIDLQTFTDERGFYREVVRIKALETCINKPFSIKQFNHSRSIKNTLRGIHIAPWNKLIYVTKGKVQVVIVDGRKDSKTFGTHESFEIGDENKVAIYVPKGCGNSFLVLSDEADYVYLTDEEWAPNREKSILWNDPDLNIDWKITDTPLLSEKDKNNVLLKDASL